MFSALSAWPRRVTSELSRVELHRTVRRVGRGSLRARELLSGLTLIEMVESVLDAAETVGPPQLRLLDAIQLASASSLGQDLGVFIAYDECLLAAATAIDLPTLAPA
ncbi:MAG: VapC toxin family PIN domain ribonuclease [Actinomycetota bacterium]|nr:VapC toxin family PIN domain ribonuclease [Actinomycetota bacterium]